MTVRRTPSFIGLPQRLFQHPLFSILRRNANCIYGQAHSLERVRSVEDFQEALPVATYEDLRPWVERILGGEADVLTSDPVLLMERTSGSTAAAKYIPYTPGLFKEFQAALAPWLWNLYLSYPGLLRGTAYLNLGLCAVNLIPAFPLDGGKLLYLVIDKR